MMDFADLIPAGIIHRFLASDPKPLLDLLRSEKPLHPEIRHFLADYIEGRIKRKRGRRPPPPDVKIRRELAWFDYDDVKRKLQASGVTDAHRAATEKLANEYNLTPDQVDKRIYPRRRHRKKQ